MTSMYKRGYKFCRYCQKWFKPETKLPTNTVGVEICPTCHYQVRTRGRYERSKMNLARITI